MRKIMLTSALIAGIAAACGSDLPCLRYDGEASKEEAQMIDDLVQVFVDLGYPEPCCPVHFCRAGEPCQSKIEGCGCIRFHDGEPVQIFLDAARPQCTEPERTAAHELLHAIKYMHGDAMDAAQTEILTEYRRRLAH